MVNTWFHSTFVVKSNEKKNENSRDIYIIKISTFLELISSPFAQPHWRSPFTSLSRA